MREGNIIQGAEKMWGKVNICIGIHFFQYLTKMLLQKLPFDDCPVNSIGDRRDKYKWVNTIGQIEPRNDGGILGEGNYIELTPRLWWREKNEIKIKNKFSDWFMDLFLLPKFTLHKGSIKGNNTSEQWHIYQMKN